MAWALDLLTGLDGQASKRGSGGKRCVTVVARLGWIGHAGLGWAGPAGWLAGSSVVNSDSFVRHGYTSRAHWCIDPFR